MARPTNFMRQNQLTVSAKMQGGAKLKKKMAKARATTRKALYEAMLKECKKIMATSKRIVPYDTGRLQESGMVKGNPGKYPSIEMGYGGAARAYALRQHEELSWKHKPGRTAKYLEKPVNAAIPRMGKRLGGDIDAALRLLRGGRV